MYRAWPLSHYKVDVSRAQLFISTYKVYEVSSSFNRDFNST